MIRRSLRGPIIAGCMLLARRGEAQGVEPPPYFEYRVDAIEGRGTTLQGGVGYTVAMATYMRVAAVAAVGPQWRGGETSVAGRTDIIARFVLDPLRQTPVGISFGGGLSVPYESGLVTRPYLSAVVDVEGKRYGPLTPAIQLGLGGGTRLGVVFRASVPRRR